MKNILIIDGNSIINRAYYGIRPLTNKNGLHTNAVYGFVNILLKNLEAINPDYAAVAFDLKAPTFRHKEYSEYKAGRHATPDELLEQFPYAKKVCTSLGFSVLELEGFEADDIIGTVSQFANTDNDIKAFILTGDRDSLQLITDKTCVLLAGNSETVTYNTSAFFAKYGVYPDVFVDVKALMGDTSDNIPGVPGVGEKTALKLISEFDSLENIYDNLESPSISKNVRSKLELGKESAYLSRFLAKIKIDVPLGISLDDIKYNGFDKHELLEIFTELEFSALIKRLELDKLSMDIAQEESKSIETAFSSISYQELERLVNNSERFAASFADEMLEGYSLSVSVNGIDNHIVKLSAEEIVKFFEEYSRKCIVYDSKNIFRSLYLSTEQNFLFDIKLAAYVADSSVGKYELDRLALKYLSETAEYTELDSSIIFRLYEPLENELIETDAISVLTDIEQPLAGVLCDMERRGFKVDTKGLAEFGDMLGLVADTIASEIYTKAGREFNIKSPKQLGEVLFLELGLPSGKKNHKGFSTSADVLEKLAPYYPIVSDVLEYRQVMKLKNTYTDALVALADVNGRIHSSFNQTVTATGRLSSTEPNLQNIPIRTELGRELRKFFIPKDGYVIIDADYSQIELRLIAEIAGDETMINAFKNGIDIHTLTASQVFDVPLEEVTSNMRKSAKAVNFGIVYGISDFSLSQDIHVTKKEAAEYISNYKSKYPKVEQYLNDIVNVAYEKGYVTTVLKRRRYIPELSASKIVLKKFGERVAMNSPIQGTAADIIKIAMINTHNSLREAGIDAHLILQVHDELLLEAHESCAQEAREILKREMENAVKTNVPLTCETSIGKTWYECK